MEPDRLQEAWTAQQERLDKSLQLNAAFLAQLNLGRAQRSLSGLAAGLGFEIAGLAVIVLFAGSFAFDHARELRFFVPAVLLWAYTIAMLVGSARQLYDVRRIDFDEPVAAVQLQIERLRLRRSKSIGWLLALGPLLWLPATIVVLRGLFGIDLYAYVSVNWIATNVVFGIAIIPLCIWISRTIGKRLGTSRKMRAILDTIAGNSIKEALQSVDATRRFGQDA